MLKIAVPGMLLLFDSRYRSHVLVLLTDAWEHGTIFTLPHNDRLLKPAGGEQRTVYVPPLLLSANTFRFVTTQKSGRTSIFFCFPFSLLLLNSK